MHGSAVKNKHKFRKPIFKENIQKVTEKKEKIKKLFFTFLQQVIP